MTELSDQFLDELEAFGALQSQIVDLERDDDPRILRYLDLRNSFLGERRPVVVETAGQPRLHVFNGHSVSVPDRLAWWCLRTTLRGDGAWIAVWEPGRLRVFQSVVHSNSVFPKEVEFSEGSDAIPQFLYDTRAGEDDLATRSYLLRLLGRSIQAAREYGLSSNDALSVVGRGLFWRFLIDRKLLQGVAPSHVSQGASTWQDCLDTKARALRTFDWLDQTFNGGLLSFDEDPRGFDKDVFQKILGNIAHGATESGQLRLPSDWSEVNFAHIPVGLLSEVYEAFAHTNDPVRAQNESIHYTPRHIAEFLVAEALASVPQGISPRVLDPAAGAGVFLVTAFRRLAERDWATTGTRPNRPKLRRILKDQIAGFDINAPALRLAELALYLTALELDPDPRPLRALRFDLLRDRVLFPLPGGSAGGSLGRVADRFRHQFDVIVGNPPWTAAPQGLAAKRRWVTDSLGVVQRRLGDDRALTFDFPDTNPDLPFLWRSMEWAKPSGVIALVTHARWLFGLSDRLQNSRRDLLEAVRVTGILNGSALRLTRVWPNVEAPFCLVFAKNELPPPNAVFQFVSPMLDAAPDTDQARIRIDWLDSQLVTVRDVLDQPWTLKVRYRGNRLSERVLSRIMRSGLRLSEYLSSLGTELKDGYQVGGTAGKQTSAAMLYGLPDFRSASSKEKFIIDTATLPVFSRKTLLRPRDRRNYRSPLLLLRESIPTSQIRPRAMRSERDLVYSESFHGASFADVPNGAAIAQYLQLALQSGLSVFYELLCDPRYGVERDTVYLESVQSMPVVPFNALSARHRARSMTLAVRLEAGMTKELAYDIDTFIFDIFELSAVDREAVNDTLAIALPSTASKRAAVRKPSREDRRRFVEILSEALNNVLSASRLSAVVSERTDHNVDLWRVIQVDVGTAEELPSFADIPMTRFLAMADGGGASLVTLRTSPGTWVIGLLERYVLWTPTRARLLATDLIAERSSNG